LHDVLSKIIPDELNAEHRKNKIDFTRDRKLDIKTLFGFILSISSDGALVGVPSKAINYFQMSDLFKSSPVNMSSTVDKGAITRARKKLPWQEFEYSLEKINKIASELLPDSDEFTWKGRSLYSVDGSKYTLPSSKELREEFDPDSGFDKKNPGKGHYPMALVLSVYDSMRKYPIYREISPNNTSEREEFLKAIPKIPDNGVILLDRGFISYEICSCLTKNYNGHFLMRCPVSCFKETNAFACSNDNDSEITITNRNGKDPIKLRAVSTTNNQGEKIILLTSLLDKTKYTTKEIVDLYKKRWEVEIGFRNEKISLNIEYFHSKNSNGIRQELFAVAIMQVLARIITLIFSKNEKNKPQIKNSIITLAKNIAVFILKKTKKIIRNLNKIISDILSVIYYKPKEKRCSYPRFSKQTINKWVKNRVVNP